MLSVQVTSTYISTVLAVCLTVFNIAYPLITFQICRDECEVLEYQLCQKELAIARSQPMISHQLVLPDCKELPVIGSADNYNCVRLGMQHSNSLLKPHSCYR